MGDQAAPEQLAGRGWLRRLGSWTAGRPIAQQGAGLLLVGLLVSAPFGGWTSTAPSGVRQVEVGRSIATGPLELTLLEVVESTRPSRVLRAQAGGTLIFVRGTVRVTGDRPVMLGTFGDSLRLVGITGLRPFVGLPGDPMPADQVKPALYYTEDSSGMSAIPPGMTFPVAWVFERATTGEDLPAALTVEVSGHTWRESGVTRGLFDWFDPTPLATTQLPLRHKPPVEDSGESSG